MAPRFVAIDSSILIGWATDAFAEDSKLRAGAREVQTSLLDSNWIPLICWHHFIELARHHNIEVATRRIDLLKSFSQIAWLGSSYGSKILGAVVDAFEAEVGTIVAAPDIDLIGLRKSVRQKLLQSGSPTDIDTLNNWKNLHPDIIATAVHDQKIASIAHSAHSIFNDTEISRLKKKRRIDQTAFNRPLPVEVKKLAEDLKDHGDRRLLDPNRTAQDFLNMAATKLMESLKLGGTAFDIFLATSDVLLSDISDKTTLRMFARLARLRKLARTACNQLGIDLNRAWPRIRDAKIPSQTIKDTIREARKTATRASGSDIGDDYLACLAPYVDAIIVDKRTHEFMTQGARRDLSFREMVGFFAKTTTYKQLPAILASYPSSRSSR